MNLDTMANAYIMGKKSIIFFRSLFLPAPDDCESAPFHYEWDKILREGTQNVVVEAFRESAKALDVNTLIPTPSGFKRMGELKVGDQVFDETGKPVDIVATSPVFTMHDCYKLIFDDGTEIIADAGHQWYVLDKHQRKYRVLTTQEMLTKYKLGSPRNGYQEYAYRIPCSEAIFMPEIELPIDPYVLGYWLGNGISAKSEISVGSQDFEEIKQILQNKWKDLNVFNDTNGNYRINLVNGFLKLLKDNNLLNNKHIPSIYLRASIEQRMELLCGLIDSDGTIAKSGTKKGTCTFTNKNKNIIEGITELLGGLGIKYTVVEKRAKLYGKDYGIVWQVSFKTTKNICKLSRKLERIPTKQDNRSKMRTIIKIEKVDTVPTKCIMVNSPNHLFLATKNCIPTHNSSLVIRAHTLYRLVYPSKNYDYIVIVKANQKEASKKLKEIAQEYMANPALNFNLVDVIEQTEKGFEVNVKDMNGNIINVRIEAYGKGAAIRGLNYKDRRPKMLIIDDPQDVEDAMSETIMKNDYDWFLSDIFFLGQTCRIFMIGNNLGAKCLVEQVIENAEDLGFDIMKVPILNEKEESNWPAKWPTDKIIKQRESFRNIGKLDVWYREKMCVSISPEDQRFKKEDFRYYTEEDIQGMELAHYITVDLAISQKQSADFTAICVVGVNTEGHWFIRDIIFGRFDPTTTMDKIFDAVVKWKPVYVGIEKVAYQAALHHFLIKEMPKRKIWFTIKELVAQQKKELRIEAMQPRFKTHTVWFKEGASYLDELETELLTFPKGLHDDLCDALAYLDQIALPPTGFSSSISDKDIPYAGAL